MAVVREVGSAEGKGTDIPEAVADSCTEVDLRGLEDQEADHGHHRAWEVDHRSWHIGRSRLVGRDQKREPWHWDHTQQRPGRRQPERRRDGIDTAD